MKFQPFFPQRIGRFYFFFAGEQLFHLSQVNRIVFDFRFACFVGKKNPLIFDLFGLSFENIVNSNLPGELKNSFQSTSKIQVMHITQNALERMNVSCVSNREQFQWMRKAFGSVHRIINMLKNAHRDEAKLPRLPRTSAATCNRYTFAAKAMLKCTRSTTALPLFQIHD